MTFSNPLQSIAVALSIGVLAGCAQTVETSSTSSPHGDEQKVRFQQIRNATVKLEYADTTFLVDPMLAEKGAYPGFEGTVNSHLRNPTVELPMSIDDAMEADAVILTHLHPDHWDEAAKKRLPKSIPIFAQNEEDAQSIRSDGFSNVGVLSENTVFRGTQLSLTDGQHGSDEMLAQLGTVLGKVSGVVFERPGYETVYLAGDTVWNAHVVEAIDRYQPDVIILNTGYARVLGFDGGILMGKKDLYRAYQKAPKATLIGSHMEAVNHATQTRQELRDYISEKGMDPQRVLIPEDGETYRF